MQINLTKAVLCPVLCVALLACSSVRHSTRRAAKVDSTATVPLDPKKSLAVARKHINMARKSLSSGNAEQAIAEIDLSSDILATVEIEPKDHPKLFKKYVELLRLLEQTRREVIPKGTPVASEDAPAIALVQILDPRSLATLSVNDVQQVMIIKKIADSSDIPLECTPAVLRQIRFYTTTARKSMETWLSRAATYTPMIRGILEEESVPLDLSYLPMIESGYNPFAYSRARANGMWQFIASTGKAFNLRIDDWVDERRDPEKSTRAAAQYLKNLHGRLGDWKLALASYNWGRLNVEKAMRKAGSRNFWKLRVPRETRSYVPSFMAVVIIARSPETFGFNNVTPGDPWHFDPISIKSPVSLRVAAKCAGTSEKIMKGLNPELKWGVTPPKKRFVLRLPPGTRERFEKRFAALSPKEKLPWYPYRVKRGDNLSSIASRNGISSKMLAKVNGLKSRKSRNRLKIGQRLLIPLKSVAQASSPPRKVRRGKTKYTVRRGDTLYGIARLYGVTVNQLRAWNDVPSARRLRPGKRLNIWKTRVRYNGSKDYHVIRRGDTLWEIAKAYGVTVNKLRAWNDVPSSKRLRPGKKLTIRKSKKSSSRKPTRLASSEKADEILFHTIRRGDTLWGISRAYGVSIRQLRKWNDISSSKRLRPGKRIIVRKPKDGKAQIGLFLPDRLAA